MTIGDGAVIGAGSVITKNIPPLTMALGVPARVVHDLKHVAEGADYSDTVETLTEAMMYGRELDRRDELELARLTHSLCIIQQRKNAQLPQNGKGSHAAEPSPPGRRGSEQGSQSSSLLLKPPLAIAWLLSGILFVGMMGLCLAAMIWWATCKKCAVLIDQISPTAL